MSTSELFASYEADFQLLSAEFTQKIEQIGQVTGNDRKTLESATRRALDEAEELLEQMTIEVQNLPSASRADLNGRLRGYKMDVSTAKKNLKAAGDASTRFELMGDRTDDSRFEQRNQLSSGIQKLEMASERLKESHQVARDTEDIGANILTDLRVQREQITHSRNTLMEADGYVDRSLGTLRKMTWRMATNRMITIGIIVLLVLLILAVIFSKFR